MFQSPLKLLDIFLQKCGDGNSSDNEEQTSGDKSADDEVNTSAQSTNDAMEFEDEGTHVEKEIVGF